MIVSYQIQDWMESWGWVQLDDHSWEKRSPSGLIVAQQGDTIWEGDCARAASYEAQLMWTRPN